jgi:hypothetical protein
MLHSMKRFYGYKLGALDGAIGHVKDFYFDDRSWTVRYAVADTGSWIRGRQVLLSPRDFREIDRRNRSLHVNLTREQIESSPPIEAHKPVSRRYQEQFRQYYDWPYYWQDSVWGMGGFPILTKLPEPFVGERRGKATRQKNSDDHLRSAHVVGRFKIHVRDESIGRVGDFVVNDETWSIQNIVMHTGAWLSGKNVLIAAEEIERISWNESTVFVKSSKEELLHATRYEESSLNEADEVTLAHHMSYFV